MTHTRSMVQRDSIQGNKEKEKMLNSFTNLDAFKKKMSGVYQTQPLSGLVIIGECTPSPSIVPSNAPEMDTECAYFETQLRQDQIQNIYEKCFKTLDW